MNRLMRTLTTLDTFVEVRYEDRHSKGFKYLQLVCINKESFRATYHAAILDYVPIFMVLSGNWRKREYEDDGTRSFYANLHRLFFDDDAEISTFKEIYKKDKEKMDIILKIVDILKENKVVDVEPHLTSTFLMHI